MPNLKLERGYISGVIAVISILLLAVVVFLVHNPFNWFVKKAPGFSEELFGEVSVGMEEAELINLLGEPLRIWRGTLSCDDCKVYVYMGDGPNWPITIKEAWVLLDAENRVEKATLYEE